VWLSRSGKYEYIKGTTSVIEERVKRLDVDVDDGEFGSLVTTTPMQYEVVDVAH